MEINCLHLSSLSLFLQPTTDFQIGTTRWIWESKRHTRWNRLVWTEGGSISFKRFKPEIVHINVDVRV